MSLPKVSFFTFGCRLNKAETATLQTNFEKHGYPVVDFGQDAEVVVVNTCTVTANGDADTRRLVNRVNREHPKADIALVGCQAQMQGEALSQLPSVKWVVGNNRKMDLPAIMQEEPALGDQPTVMVEKISREPFTMPMPALDRHHTRANLKIQDGCDFYCLFCEIPYARGRARSRDFNDLMNEASLLLNGGHQEIVLTGVNIGTYQEADRRIFHVIQDLLKLEKLKRLRISSIEPTTIPNEIVIPMQKDFGLCRYLHIPIQSGDNEILRTMNRRYDIEEYTEFLNFAYKQVPDICLGTDVIVGYPGETDESFDRTRQLLLDLPFAYFHVFSYSERSMAKSKKVFGKYNVPVEKIQERSKIMRDISNRKRHMFMERHMDEPQTILVESPKDGWWNGLTDNYVRISFKSDQNLLNQFVQVKPTGFGQHGLVGELI
ncbi:MAG: tRNA (N(6)-L-threonylcarbamoyladenosine(37)-C(2))-methylthiotransferase MtaB [Lentisphaeria bacterium]|nr:tRNA (N(6)-L-threonylcarbamoyladenosine(37)-C(2))-methylthiotransferase MtaB [Lentisphaeria bacterium]